MTNELKGDEAVALWKQGKDAWNEWVDENPNATIDFSKVDFTACLEPTTPLNFKDYRFGNGDVTFNYATFGGDVSFKGAKFGTGKLSFGAVQYHETIVFAPSKLLSSSFIFLAVQASRATLIEFPDNCIELTNIDFRGAAFDGPLFVRGAVPGIPDLRGTKTAHHVDISALKVTLRRDWPGWHWPFRLSKVTNNSEDAARLRRLKEIAEANKDHQAALRFAADENRAKRWIETSWWGSVLDMAFSGFSNYGQSILRPSVALSLLIPLFALVYMSFSPLDLRGNFSPSQFTEHGLALSLSNTVPFLPPMVTTRTDTVDLLFPADNPGILVHAAMAAQSLLSLVFVFLIGLGLRNRFRL